VKLHQQGDLVSAEALYQSLLLTEPGNLQATYLLGLVGSQTQRPELAITNIEKYLKTHPADAQAISILALAYFDLKNYTKARTLMERSITMRGDSPHLYYNLGKTHFALQSYANAVTAYDTAIRLQPGYVDALIGKAVSHKELKEFEIAACALEQAILLEPRRAESHFFYGNVMRAMGNTQDAIDAYKTALSINPEYIEALINCATSLKDINSLEDSLLYYNKALALSPNHPEGNYNKALTLLMDGQLSLGWNLYEWRLYPSELLIKNVRAKIIQKAPEWDGIPFNGHLLVMVEQGLGDQIFFANMLSDLRLDVKEITACIDQRLIPILKRSFPEIKFLSDTEVELENNFDAQIYLGSLGRFYRSDNESFTKIRCPYLIADSGRATQIRAQIKQGNRLLCGISWRSKNSQHGELKSLSLETLSQPLSLTEVDFVDLQYGDTQAERQDFEAKTGIHIKKLDEIDNFTDIDDLAALIKACDIIVTVSNTTAHLAAALGKPTLVLLPQTSVVFWYWHREGDQSAWYPSVRLLRKEDTGDWASVIDAVTLTLAGIA
jgi:tetratricopeptide (TPR) repeat protein